MNDVAKLVFTGNKNELAKIKKRTRSSVIVHNIDVEFSDVKPVKATETKKESVPKKADSKKSQNHKK